MDAPTLPFARSADDKNAEHHERLSCNLVTRGPPNHPLSQMDLDVLGQVAAWRLTQMLLTPAPAATMHPQQAPDSGFQLWELPPLIPPLNTHPL